MSARHGCLPAHLNPVTRSTLPPLEDFPLPSGTHLHHARRFRHQFCAPHRLGLRSFRRPRASLPSPVPVRRNRGIRSSSEKPSAACPPPSPPPPPTLRLSSVTPASSFQPAAARAADNAC